MVDFIGGGREMRRWGGDNPKPRDGGGIQELGHDFEYVVYTMDKKVVQPRKKGL